MKTASLILALWFSLTGLAGLSSIVAQKQSPAVAKLVSASQSASLSGALTDPASAEPSGSTSWSCLPDDVRADEVIAYGHNKKSNVSVGKKLIEIKARCRRGKLVDAKGREVRFFRPACWGNPPADYQEIRQQESATLAKLKQRYLVIVFACSPMIP